MNTTLMPFHSGFGLLESFRKEMDQLFDRFSDGERGRESSITTCWTPRLNLSETEDAYEVSVDLPGLTADAVNVELRHGDLWISGERRGETEANGQTWHRIERHFGQFRRAVRLGDDVDPERVNAEYRDGVLYITVPKTEVARTKRIDIKS